MPRLIFYEPVPRLEDTAAFKVALDLWLYYVRCERQHTTNTLLDRVCITDSYRTREVDVRRMVDVLKLPSLVAESIKTRVKSICAQVLALSSYCRDQVFFRDLRSSAEGLSTSVWKPNGTIDYEKIIRKVIGGGELNERQKFALMCEYCMEDDIREAWPQLADRQFLEEAQFNSSPLLVYWDCVMRADFSKMRVADIAAARNCVFEHNRGRNPTATEYFFDRMSCDDRIAFGMRLMEKGGAKLVKLLLPKYTEDEQSVLLFKSDFFIQLMKIFVLNETLTNVEYALETWLRVRNAVSESQFMLMLEKLGAYDDRNVQELLVEVWRCSPVWLKQFVYQLPLDGEFVYKLCIRPGYIREYGGDFRQREDGLLIQVLADAHAVFRTELWRRYWPNIVDRSKPASLKAIANLCLSKSEAEQVRHTIVADDQCRRYFIDLIANGKYSDLLAFLGMFVGGEKRQLNEASRRLLEGMPDPSSIVVKCEPTEAAVKVLRDFLVDVFADDVDGLSRFQTNVILHCLVPHELRARFELVRHFTVLERLCDERTLARGKEQVLRRCKVAAADPQTAYCVHKKPEWSMLIAWCCSGSDDRVDEFYRSL